MSVHRPPRRGSASHTSLRRLHAIGGAATRHLSRIERCIYRDMMDLYYAKERPLLADEAALFRLLLIRDPDEVAGPRVRSLRNSSTSPRPAG